MKRRMSLKFGTSTAKETRTNSSTFDNDASGSMPEGYEITDKSSAEVSSEGTHKMTFQNRPMVVSAEPKSEMGCQNEGKKPEKPNGHDRDNKNHRRHPVYAGSRTAE